ncbi:MAG: hypothetical protein LC134_02115 [Chitinophagales bacterium]|nr:hypothetical protein [Chitinophagales bacterium]
MTFVVVIIATVSCKKHNFDNEAISAIEISQSAAEEFKISTEFVSLSVMQEITARLTNEDSSGIIEDSLQIQEILSPLIHNGRQLHEELIRKVSESEEWLSMSEDERDAVLNFSDNQCAELSFIYSLSNPDIEEEASSANISVDAIRHCVAVALGINGIKDYITGTAELMTVKGTIKILKTFAKRYIGIIGIAWMIWDFTDCISHF